MWAVLTSRYVICGVMNATVAILDSLLVKDAREKRKRLVMNVEEKLQAMQKIEPDTARRRLAPEFH